MSDATGVVVRAATSKVQRATSRVASLLVTLAGLGTFWAAWGLAPWYVYGAGAVFTALGIRMQLLVERADRESLTVGVDGHLLIHSPALLRRDVRLHPEDIRAVSYVEPQLNGPVGETRLTLLGDRGHLRIELNQPRVLAGARPTNYLWCLRAESDPQYLRPPLPRTEAAVLDFHVSPSDADVVLRHQRLRGPGTDSGQR